MVFIWQCLGALSMSNPPSGRRNNFRLRPKHASPSTRWTVRLQRIHQRNAILRGSLWVANWFTHHSTNLSLHNAIASQTWSGPHCYRSHFPKRIPNLSFFSISSLRNLPSILRPLQLFPSWWPWLIPCSPAPRIIFQKYKSDLVTYLP